MKEKGRREQDLWQEILKIADKKKLSSDKRQQEKGPDCFSGGQLADLIDGKCSEEEVGAIRSHLKNCSLCRSHCTSIAALKMGELRGELPERRSGLRRWAISIVLLLLLLGMIWGFSLFFLKNGM